MMRLREARWRSALPLLDELRGRLRSLAERSLHLPRSGIIPGLNPADEAAAAAAFRSAVPPAPGPESSFIMYWTLMAAPWPGSIAPQGGGAPQPVARALGGLFDNVALPHTRLRDLANRWTTWSDGHLLELAKTHRAVLDARVARSAV